MVSSLHSGLANTTTLFALALTVWGFFRFLRGEGVDGNYLGAVAVGEGLIIAEALLGVFALAGGAALPNPALHILYGVCTVISFPGLFAFTRGESSRREMLLWALISFFVFGLTLRARIVAG